MCKTKRRTFSRAVWHSASPPPESRRHFNEVTLTGMDIARESFKARADALRGRGRHREEWIGDEETEARWSRG